MDIDVDLEKFYYFNVNYSYADDLNKFYLLFWFE